MNNALKLIVASLVILLPATVGFSSVSAALDPEAHIDARDIERAIEETGDLETTNEDIDALRAGLAASDDGADIVLDN